MARARTGKPRGWQPRFTRCRPCYEAGLSTYLAIKMCPDCAARYALKSARVAGGKGSSGTVPKEGGGRQ